MQSHDLSDWTTPVGTPFYPKLPCTFRNAKWNCVFFHAAPQAVQRFLPDKLTASDDGLCVAMGMDLTFTSNYGRFLESVVQLKCAFKDKVGWYASHVFHSHPGAISAGREIYGTPKVYAHVQVTCADGMMVTRAEVGSLPVMTVAATFGQPCEIGEVPALKPSWRLKLIPRVDGPGPALKQLVDGTPVVTDRKIHVASKGHGSVQFLSLIHI